MLFEGETIKAEELGEGLVELCFDRKAETVNKLDRLAFSELSRALEIISKAPGVSGVLVTSAKDAFVVGADIFEFVDAFAREMAIIASIAIQYGATVDELRHAVLRDAHGQPSTPLGAVLDLLAAEERK